MYSDYVEIDQNKILSLEFGVARGLWDGAFRHRNKEGSKVLRLRTAWRVRWTKCGLDFINKVMKRNDW